MPGARRLRRGAQIARMRLAAQGVGASRWRDPEEVVAALGAVQAQDYLGALWAIGVRLASAREPDVERALAERRIVRSWPLRGTLHFVAAADLRWMLDLAAARVVARAGTRFRQLGLDDATFTRARRTLEKRLADGRALARPLVYEALERSGVSTAGQRGIHIVWRLAHDGLLCLGPREGKQHTFVLLDAWIAPSARLQREEALARLATRYFTGHGPATTRDFAWWSGLAAAEASAAVGLAAGNRLEHETWDGETYWFAPPTPRAGRARAGAHLLPAFDELLVGYADRTAMLDPAHSRRVNAGGGMLNPAVVRDARVIGTWKRTLAREHVDIRTSLFAPPGPATVRALATASARYARFLGRACRCKERSPA